MGRKSVLKPFKMIDAGDLSGNITSNVTSTTNLDKAFILVEWSGTAPVGVLTVQGRNGEDTAWVDISMGSVINITGNTGNHQLIFNELPFTDLRLSYAATSGVGSIDATISAKVTGA